MMKGQRIRLISDLMNYSGDTLSIYWMAIASAESIKLLTDTNEIPAKKEINVYPNPTSDYLYVLEVDVRIELIDTKFATAEEYIFMKTGKVLDLGVERLIWILSQSGKVVVAEKGKTWEIFNWDQELEFLHGIKFNIANYLKEEGVNIES